MKKILIFLILLPVLILSGCFMGLIHEDLPIENLPQVDPNGGAMRMVHAKLYYMLDNEELLIPLDSTIKINGNERTEYAIIRALIEGCDNIYAENCFLPGTRVIDVTESGSIFYVTMSKEMIETDQSSSGYSSLAKRMRLYSIVNSICDYNKDSRVQILVDADGSGDGERFPLSVLGFSGQDNLIEPRTFQNDIIASPPTVILAFLQHMVHFDYVAAYNLLSDVEMSGLQKPSYTKFLNSVHAIGTIANYSVLSTNISKNGLTADIRIIVTIIDNNGISKDMTINLSMMAHIGVYKLNYSSWEKAFLWGEER
ncbi:MAG: GerMN domain-containing protein [Clostridia bacterium]